MNSSTTARSGKVTKTPDQKELDHFRVAILATDGFEQSELIEPKKALEEAGASVEVIAPHSGSIQGWKHHDKGEAVPVTRVLAEADSEDYDALVLPGGVVNADALRTVDDAITFVQALAKADKPIAAICHGPWILIEAGLVRGKTLTSWPSLQTDLSNAGALWRDQTVICDENLVSSRKPADLPDFNREMIRVFSESRSKAGQLTGTTDEKRRPPSTTPTAVI